MESDDTDGDAFEDTREQGIEFGQLKRELETHEYPTTGDELLAAYGDFELDLPGGSVTLREVLGKRHGEQEGDDDIRYESAEDVHRSIQNMVGSEAVGRENYTDRGGSQQGGDGEENDAQSI